MKNTKVILLAFVLAVLGACQGKQGANTSGNASGNIPPLVAGMRTIYFDFDDSSIRSDQVSSMQSNAQHLKNNSSLRVAVEGHCDERGTNEYNLALGDRRAAATQNYLTNLGIDPARMSTVSYGEERAACSSSDEECWAQNRRVEFRKQ